MMLNGRRPRATSAARPPTTEELTRDTADLFANAGKDVPPLTVDDLDAEIERLSRAIQPGANWDDQVAAMQRLMSLISGGALSNDGFRRRVSQLSAGLSAAATNLRSALVKQSCLVIAQLARALGSGFDQLGDLMGPLSTQLSHGTQIISESCKLAILAMVMYCQTRRMVLAIGDLAGKKGPAQRAVAAESFAVIFQHWSPETYAPAWQRIEPIVLKLLEDASPDVRVPARNAVRLLQTANTGAYERIMGAVDPRLRREITAGSAPSTAIPISHSEGPKRAIPTPRAVASASKPVRAATKRAQSVQQQPERIQPPEKPQTSPRLKRKPIEKPEKPAEPTPKIATSARTPHRKFALVPGQERAFLSTVRHTIDEGDMSQFEGSVADLSLGVLKCCLNESPLISAPAYAILHDIIPPFRLHFEPSLPKLVPMLLHTLERGSGRASATAQLILNGLASHFDVNALLASAVTQKPIDALVYFVKQLVESPVAQLTNDALCDGILKIVRSVQNHTDLQVRHAAGHIAVRINELNPSALAKFCSSLSDGDNQTFVSFLRPYVPLPQATASTISVPQFDPKGTASFRRKVLDVAHSATATDWARIRGELYDEVNRSISCENCDKASFQLVTKLFADKGLTEYHRLLPGLLSQSKGPCKPCVDTIIVELLNAVDRVEVVAAIGQCITSERVGTAQAAIELITRIIATVSKGEVVKLVTGVFPLLTQALQHEAPEIRKAGVLCFVEMKVVAGTEVDGLISQLTRTHQKLIGVYYQRRLGT
jgi:hypothetical protein